MLNLIDLLRLSNVELQDFKIHCATGKNVKLAPLEAFFDGTFEQWQACQSQKNFKCKHIVSLIHLGGRHWLFAGVFSVLGVKPGNIHNPNGYEYETEELEGLQHLTGRAVVDFNKTFRASYLRGDKHKDQLMVVAIREQRMTIGDFPGFNGVLLSHTMLKTIVREANPSWRAALANVAGVYVITDITSGKQYVGSAYGGVGIWQRWSEYAKTGHGGNKELKQLLKLHGVDHAQSLQMSILEVCDLNASSEYVISRESHWKNVLKTREFGLNAN